MGDGGGSAGSVTHLWRDQGGAMVLPEGASTGALRAPRFAVLTEHVEIYLVPEVETDDEWESGTQIDVSRSR